MLAVLLEISDMTESQKTRFETVYYKYRRLLFTIIRKKVSCDSDAEDILQNTFIKIARNIDKLGDTESKETIAFLTVIAKNTYNCFGVPRRTRTTIGRLGGDCSILLSYEDI